MKKILLMATGLLVIGCENRTTTTECEASETSTNKTETINAQSVAIGAGTEISPQL